MQPQPVPPLVPTLVLARAGPLLVVRPLAVAQAG
jgi:hypothetical protein